MSVFTQQHQNARGQNIQISDPTHYSERGVLSDPVRLKDPGRGGHGIMGFRTGYV